MLFDFSIVKRWEKTNSLVREHKNICFMFRNNFFHKTPWERARHPRCLKKRMSDVSKVLFPDIGKITNPVCRWFCANLQMDCLKSRRLLQKIYGCKCQFCTKVSNEHLQRLVSQVHKMAGQNIKEKYLMCQIPIKMLKQYATPNSSSHNLRIYSSKGCRKTSQRWIYVTS